MNHRIYSEASGEVEEHTVVNTFVHDDNQIVYLTIDGEEIETTAWHPFYTAEGEWDMAGDLETGDRILALDGSYGTVKALTIVKQSQAMYDLTVAEAHTFAVGAGEWVVHNCPAPLPKITNITHPDPISMDEALRKGIDHTGSNAEIKQTPGGNYQWISSSNGAFQHFTA